MRIIGGKIRNKKLFFTENVKTRPLKDSVRENLFNINNIPLYLTLYLQFVKKNKIKKWRKQNIIEDEQLIAR